MVVGAAGRDEPELIPHCAHRPDGAAVEGPVVDLQSAQAAVTQLADDRDPVGGLGEMGQDRESAGGPDRVDRHQRADPLPRDVGRSSAAEIAREPVLDAADVALGLEQTRDGRPAERRGLGRIQPRRDIVDRQVELAQSGQRPLEPDPSLGALDGQRVASKASFEGSTPRPRMWSSLSHSSGTSVVRQLISTPGRRVSPAGSDPAPDAVSSR